ncbi:DNA repair protein RecN [Pseudogemmobacter faecipullorum]|uniref:DNA repair protein RecN n=1 Tax=Pseudogemmobacter faecipullorum TaxID=2755041 RepID=A0ABS8CM09_9RHOB|nr:DNA repair protein RecN [Pseudogemmobacter faecipullorum]MCB5410203.1 DNA repair protein RecN [Pseudogemmobacter faecipullorum]
MLISLDIRDILIIDRLSLALGPGLNVLTGETGAGKSILLDALGMVLGWKGRADLVRQGAEKGEVTAVFDLPPGHPAVQVLEEAGVEVGGEVGGELILRRLAHSDGRRQAWANDRRVSAEVLRNLSESLVELHGQHDDRGLLNPRGHRALLDAFGGYDLAPLRTFWGQRRQAAEALEAAEQAIARARTEEEFLRHAVGELDKLAPQPGEEAVLDAKRRMMQGAARIREDVSRALASLAEEGAEGRMRDATRWLEGVSDRAEGRLDEPLAALSRALIELSEAQSGVESALHALDFNPAELEACEERLFAIRALARKYGTAPDDLAREADSLRARLNALDAGEAGLAQLNADLKAAEAVYADEAALISGKRAVAASQLDTAMAAELAPLKMERAVFRSVITAAEPGPDGQDQVTFTVATNPGAPPGALNKIASGGELSRFLLALKVCLTGGGAGLTMIFDEIDRGVGGATADAVGRRLQALSENAQVLVVTHSPQVAALGAHHWRVQKSVVSRAGQEITLSTVVPLAMEERVEEIARMLAGDRVTDAARQAALALIPGT